MNTKALHSMLVTLAIFQTVATHPGDHGNVHQMHHEITARDLWASQGARSLRACGQSQQHRDLSARSAKRRADSVKRLRKERGIVSSGRKWKKDLAALELYDGLNHNMTGIYEYDESTPESTIFSSNSSCILTPEVTDGPYYVWGEMIRKNVKEEMYSDGIDLYLEVQYIDSITCQPLSGLAIDIWNANATGVYSGISVDDNYAADGYNSTYLRGIQLTDSDGVASFETIFPGHYEGRATHTHLLTHMNTTINENGTLAADTGSIVHIGQLFWNEVLRADVEANSPYNTNTQAITSNEDDMWSIVQAESDYDPFPEYIYLGENVTDGLFAWIQIGLNTSQDLNGDDYYAIAAYLSASGGYATSGGMDGNGPEADSSSSPA